MFNPYAPLTTPYSLTFSLLDESFKDRSSKTLISIEHLPSLTASSSALLFWPPSLSGAPTVIFASIQIFASSNRSIYFQQLCRLFYIKSLKIYLNRLLFLVICLLLSKLIVK